MEQHVVGIRHKGLYSPSDMLVSLQHTCVDTRWARRASNVQGVVLSGHTNWVGVDISAFNLGLLSLFTRQLRVLRLVKCFHRSFMNNALQALEHLTGLEELCIWGHVAYLNSAPGITALTRLKSLSLRRCSSTHRMLRLSGVPEGINNITLENVEILPKELLRLSALTDLTLSFSKWHGNLLACISVLYLLENLTIHSSFSATSEPPEHLAGFHILRHLDHLQHLKITVNSLEISGGSFTGAHGMSSLVSLHLESYAFDSPPLAIFELPLLEELVLNHGHLRDLPMTSSIECLRVLNLNFNEFTEVPSTLQYASGLEVLSLCGNPLKFTRGMEWLASLPRLETVKFGWDQLHNENRQLLESR